MKKLYLLLAIFSVPVLTLAAEAPGIKLDPVSIDLNDKPSLQRGAQLFVNYCLSCHSAAYMRYNRMGRDLAISDELVIANLMFVTDKIGELMTIAMSQEDAKRWFGTLPPDLTLVTRSRGPTWVYNYMRGFYREDKWPGRWNNALFPNVAMPHVLYGLQGTQRAVFETKDDGSKVLSGFELERPGLMDKARYDAAMRDLTNF
ncbi:MAG: cytochrome c1, partial [Burkholderiales bacterium]|nr:cytochrome c1 [Burkholderiales bacterium]